MKKLTGIIEAKNMVQPDYPVSEEKRLEMIANLQELIDLEKIKDTMTLKEFINYKVKSAAYNWQETPTSVINELQVQSHTDEIMEAIEKLPTEKKHLSFGEKSDKWIQHQLNNGNSAFELNPIDYIFDMLGVDKSASLPEGLYRIASKLHKYNIMASYDYARTICDIESGEEYYNKNYNKEQNLDLNN